MEILAWCLKKGTTSPVCSTETRATLVPTRPTNTQSQQLVELQAMFATDPFHRPLLEAMGLLCWHSVSHVGQQEKYVANLPCMIPQVRHP